MGELPNGFPVLAAIAKLDRRAPALGLFFAAIAATLALNKRLRKYGAHLLYQTLGQALPLGAASAAPLWFIAHQYAKRHRGAVKRAGHRGTGRGLGEALFKAILESRSGTLISEHRYEDTWSFLRHPDGKVHLDIPEMLEAISALRTEAEPSDEFPFILIAGERRAYNANTIFRDPAWRKQDHEGALAIHPTDADLLGLADGDRVICRSGRGELEVTIRRSTALRPGVVSLPHGFGIAYGQSGPVGPQLNHLTDGAHRDSIAATPFHKSVPVKLERVAGRR